MKDYGREIDKAIQSYEEYKPYHTHTIDWITDRIDWCWQFRKISKEQMEEFAGRIIEVMER